MATLTDIDAPHTQGIAALQPGELLTVAGARSVSLLVVEGVVYVALEEAEAVLTPGDCIALAAGERYRAHNAGDDVARVVVRAA